MDKEILMGNRMRVRLRARRAESRFALSRTASAFVPVPDFSTRLAPSDFAGLLDGEKEEKKSGTGTKEQGENVFF